MYLRAVVSLLRLSTAVAVVPAFSSCGADSDHFRDVKIVPTPEQPVKGHPFTLSVTGRFDTKISGGHISIDLNINVENLIKRHVIKGFDFTVSPAIIGDQRLVLGPFNIPDLPGKASVKGTVKISDLQGQAVACLALDSDVGGPSIEAQIPDGSISADHVTGRDCGSSGDHLKWTASKSGNESNFKGWFDEDVQKAVLAVDVEVHALFIKLPIRLSIPVLYTPGFVKGPIEVNATEKPLMPSFPELVKMPWGGVKMTGIIKANDSASQEIFCIDVSHDTMPTVDKSTDDAEIEALLAFEGAGLEDPVFQVLASPLQDSEGSTLLV